MLELFRGDYAQLIIGALVLLVLVGIGSLLIKKARLDEEDSSSGTHSMMSEFREAHARGELSDEEYRNIKQTLAAKLREEFEDRDSAGHTSIN